MTTTKKKGRPKKPVPAIEKQPEFVESTLEAYKIKLEQLDAELSKIQKAGPASAVAPITLQWQKCRDKYDELLIQEQNKSSISTLPDDALEEQLVELLNSLCESQQIGILYGLAKKLGYVLT